MEQKMFHTKKAKSFFNESARDHITFTLSHTQDFAKEFIKKVSGQKLFHTVSYKT